MSLGAGFARSDAEARLRRPMSEPNVAIARGVVWALSRIDDARVPALLEAAGREFYFKKFGDFRSQAAGNAVLWSLGQIGTLEATYALARLRRAIRDKSVAKLVDAALAAAGAKVGLGLDDMQDLATPDYGIGPDGTRTEMLGTHAVTLAVVSSRKATLTSLDTSAPKARTQARHPEGRACGRERQSPRRGARSRLQADIALLLPEARARLQSSWRRERCWRLADWRERFLDNGLVATLSRRLVWRFETAAAARAKGFRAPRGRSCWRMATVVPLPGPETRVRLWHPLTERVDAVMAWRERLKACEIRQPFAQAWRANYVVTDAERETRTYSNRFAGHILHQPPLIAILRKRGWIAASRVAYDEKSDAKPNRLLLPAFGVAAEFWFSGVGAPSEPTDDYGAPNYEYVTTDRLVFHALDATSRAGRRRASAARAGSCHGVQRDAVRSGDSNRRDLHRGGPFLVRPWRQRFQPAPEVPAPGDTATVLPAPIAARPRRCERRSWRRCCPRSAISESCHVAGDWLMVDGSERPIASIWARARASSRKAAATLHRAQAWRGRSGFSPFEGDPTLSLILSKAMLLAQDDRIEDPTILSQLAV